MDGILALGHFCESHGPCVVLATEGYKEDPTLGHHNITVPWCEACQSLQHDQAFVSRNENCSYVTTRTSLQQDTAFLLKRAVTRSLSCEQEGTLYFGDNETGHVFSHTFIVHDSLARGFQRKYAILMFMRNKIHLLNKWSVLTKHVKKIAEEIRNYSSVINVKEQAQQSQRAVRQAQGSPSNPGRSLSELTGKPAIYAHLHLWFVWLLEYQMAETKYLGRHLLPIPTPSLFLRPLYQEMGEVFQKVFYLFLIGIPITSTEDTLIAALKTLLPDETWVEKLVQTEYCNVFKENGKWVIETDVTLPNRLPTLQCDIQRALEDTRLTDAALEHHVGAIIMHWLHNSRVLTWCPQIDLKLLQSLNIQKADVPLLIFWTSQCVQSLDKHKVIVKTLNNLYC